MRRDIFTKEIPKLQQGCIFDGAIADGIDDTVFGLIITPRCDIENNKVLNVNYLTITTLQDWVSRDLLAIYRAKEEPKRRRELECRMGKTNKNLKLEPQYKLSLENLNQIFPDKRDNDLKTLLLNYWELFDDSKCYESLKTWKNYKSKLKELADGKLERYLLLESWEDDCNDFYVIHLTQIRHISFPNAQQLIDGLQPRLVDPEIDDLVFDEKPTAKKYTVVAQLSSPYIEYVCQKFSNAFFRIGIENWPHNRIEEHIQSIIH